MAVNVSINSILTAMVTALSPMTAPIGGSMSPTLPLHFVKPFFGEFSINEAQQRAAVGRTPCAFVSWERETKVSTTISRRVDRNEQAVMVVICSDSMRSRDDRSTIIAIGEQVKHLLGARQFGLKIKPLRWQGISVLFDDDKIIMHAARFTTRTHVDYTIDPGIDLLTDVRGDFGIGKAGDYKTLLLAQRLAGGMSPRNYWPLDLGSKINGISQADAAGGGVALSPGLGWLDGARLPANSLTGSARGLAGSSAAMVASPGVMPASFSIEAQLEPLSLLNPSLGLVGFPEFSLGINAAGKYVLLKSGTAVVTSAGAYLANVRRHVAARYNTTGTAWDLWVDGAMVGSAVATAPTVSGQSFNIRPDTINAEIGHVLITSGVLTPALIASAASLGQSVVSMHRNYP